MFRNDVIKKEQRRAFLCSTVALMGKRQIRAVIRRVDAPTIRTDWFSDAKEAREQLAAVLPFPEEFLVRWENREVEIEEASA